MKIRILSDTVWVIEFDGPRMSDYEMAAVVRDIKAMTVRKRYFYKERTWRLYLPLTYTQGKEIYEFIHMHNCRFDKDVIAHIAALRHAHEARQESIFSARHLKREGSEHGIMLRTYTKPWAHQIRMVEFARRVDATLWWGGMGVGKSKALIDLIVNTNAENVLIVCPKPVMDVWPQQFRLHAPADWDRLVLLNKGSVKDKSQILLETRNMPAIYVINYDSIWRDPINNVLLNHDWDLIACDEVHRIKAPGSNVSRYMERLGKKADRRLGLSGTPIPQGPLDAYGIFRFLDPDIFGKSFARFRNRYAVMGGFGGYQVLGYRNLDEFYRKFESITFEVTRDVLDLPDAMDIDVPVSMPASAKSFYQRMEKDFIAWTKSGDHVTAPNALAKLLRLQQITSGFTVTDDKQIEHLHAEKVGALQEIIEDCDEPMVIFVRFRQDIASIKQILKVRNIPELELSGERNDMEKWQEGQGRILIVQIQAGSEGVDLTRCGSVPCRRAIYYSLGFSLHQYLQSRARIHRPGQEETCFYHHLVVPGTIDEQIYKALQEKQDVVQAVLDAITPTHDEQDSGVFIL